MARRLPPERGGPPEPFETGLREHEHERHRRILEGGRPFPEAPRGFRYEDVLGLPSHSGFLPLDQAAEAMTKTPEQVMEMVRQGLLETDRYGKVRPAIVTLIGVSESPRG